MQSLATRRLDLVPLDPDRDAAALHRMLGDRDGGPFVDPPTADLNEARTRLARQLAGNGGWTWAIRFRPDLDAVGIIGLFAGDGQGIRGLSWQLRRDLWGQGIMSEAAAVVVDYLVGPGGFAGLEAWIDSANSRSLGVARHARLTERARLPRVYADRTAQTIVMARAATETDPEIFGITPTLRVCDLSATIDLLSRLLPLQIAFRTDHVASLAIAPWSGSPGIMLVATTGDIAPAHVTIDIGIATDDVYARAIATGVEILGPPHDQPWFRREFVARLPDGHELCISGPTRPVGNQS